MFKKKFNYRKNQSTHDPLIISLSDDCTKPITTGETLSAEIPLSNPIGLLSFKAAVKKLMYLLDLEEMGEFWDHVKKDLNSLTFCGTGALLTTSIYLSTTCAIFDAFQNKLWRYDLAIFGEKSFGEKSVIQRSFVGTTSTRSFFVIDNGLNHTSFHTARVNTDWNLSCVLGHVGQKWLSSSPKC